MEKAFIDIFHWSSIEDVFGSCAWDPALTNITKLQPCTQVYQVIIHIELEICRDTQMRLETMLELEEAEPHGDSGILNGIVSCFLGLNCLPQEDLCQCRQLVFAIRQPSCIQDHTRINHVWMEHLQNTSFHAFYVLNTLCFNKK